MILSSRLTGYNPGMRRTRIKICGVRDPDIAWTAAQAGADAIGLVFVPDTPRAVSVEQARPIVAALPALVQPIALFVNPTADEVRHVTQELGIGTVQLHGEETPEFAASLWPLRVIKAMAFDPRKASASLGAWRGACPNLSGLLFDAPPADTQRGGTGRTLDWDALSQLMHSGLLAGLPPVILAGGLSPENVREAIESVSPYAVDVSSGVESQRGVKDPQRIEAFCRAVRMGADPVVT